MVRHAAVASLALLLSPTGAHAQGATALPVVPGYESTADCPAIQPCFVPSTPSKSVLNITTGTVAKSSPGVIGTVCLNATASTASTVLDSATSSVTASATILTIPSTTAAGTYFTLNWPTVNGIAVAPGSGGVLAISYQ